MKAVAQGDGLRGFPAEHTDLGAAVSPYSYNPSGWSQRLPICVLAIVAFLMATHMALFQWNLIASPWDPVFGNQSALVLKSDVAEKMHLWVGIPDAALGALAYLGDAIFGLAGSTRRWQYRPWLVILFGLDVIPLGIVSVILVILQGALLQEWCFLCLLTAGISLILIYMAYDEVHVSLKYLWRVWKKTHDKREVWKALWGQPTERADEVAAELVTVAD